MFCIFLLTCTPYGFYLSGNASRFDRNEKAVLAVWPYLVAPPGGDQNLPHLQKPLLEYTQGKAPAQFQAVIISIYCLKDPGTGETMYVGATRNATGRFSAHIWDTRDCEKTRWVSRLKANGQRPKFLLLAKTSLPFADGLERHFKCLLAPKFDGGGAPYSSHPIHKTCTKLFPRGTPRQ